MIAYYVHHHGHGHRHRATAIAQHLETPVTGLSSAPRPDGWVGAWVDLPRDDAAVDEAVDPTAAGTLHWVPEHDAGLRERMAEVSAWIRDVQPSLLVADVSVEVALLARLHGVPVVTTVLPGHREDEPHETVHRLSRRVLAAWPEHQQDMVQGLDVDDPRVARVGAISRFDDAERPTVPREDDRPHVVVLHGSGGSELADDQLDQARAVTPRWRWTVLGGPDGWDDDPWATLLAADVVVTHAGQNALAEVAAARVPAVVLPQSRPHDEQVTTAAALARTGRYPVVVPDDPRDVDWAAALEAARRLDGEAWSAWNDGQGARRAAAVIEAEIRRGSAE